jgi:hypothetical protein
MTPFLLFHPSAPVCEAAGEEPSKMREKNCEVEKTELQRHFDTGNFLF